jgi:hypothetical protein
LASSEKIYTFAKIIPIMQKFALIFYVFFAIFPANAQYRYSVRAQGYGGMALAMGDRHTEILTKQRKGIVVGGEIDFEFQPTGKHQWEQFWAFPTFGIGILGLDFGNPKMLGQAFAAYPYLLVPIIKNNYFRLNYKVGAGMSFFTKFYKNAPHQEGTLSGANGEPYGANAVIGSVANIYLTTGANFEFPINNTLAISADIGYSHMSNGSIQTPNKGFNIIYAQIGAKYNFKDCNECKRNVKNPANKLPYDFIANIGVSGGFKELYYRDNKKFFVGEIHAGLTTPLTNWYGLGGGFNLFFDGAFNKRDISDASFISKSFTRYYLPENKFENKIRFGISVNNEFIIGKITGILDWGFYLYNPLKNYENGEKIVKERNKKPFNKRIFYKYNINDEDGWNYFRLGVRYRIWDNLFVSVYVKTHLQKAEMITLGIGYYLPFARAGKHATMKKELKNYYLHHFTQKEATAFPTNWR